MKKYTLLSNAVFILMASAITSFAAINYIDPDYTGSTRDGTINNPYNSWADMKANRGWKSNDVYLQKRGTVAKEQIEFAGVTNVLIDAYGSGTEKAKIDGEFTRSYGFRFYTTTAVTIKNFEIYETLDAGILILGSEDYIIRDNIIHNINYDGVTIEDQGGTNGYGVSVNSGVRGPDGIISFNHIYDTWCDGIAAQTLNPGITAQNNLVERYGNDGIDVLGSQYAVLEGNVCRDGYFGTKDSSTGLKAGGNEGSGGGNNTVRYNRTSGNYHVGIYNRNAAGNTYMGNAAFENGTNYNFASPSVASDAHISYNYSIDATYDSLAYDVYMPPVSDIDDCNNNIWVSPIMKIHLGTTYTTLSGWQTAYSPYDSDSTFTDTPHPFMETDDTVALYYLDENEGSSTKDWSDNGHTGTLSNMTWGAGRYINAAVFNGTNSYISIADDDGFSFTDAQGDLPVSVSAWIYLDEQRNCRIVTKRNGSSNCEWELYYNSTYGIYFTLYSGGSNQYYIGRYTKTPLSTGQWIHVAASYDGSGTRAGVRLFIDGVEDLVCGNAGSESTYSGMSNTSASVIIGASSNGTYQPFKGKIDQVRIEDGTRYTSDFDTYLP
jgi:Concanavalin A-like lectin/glucanases superfamily/Right handed beta helix region